MCPPVRFGTINSARALNEGVFFGKCFPYPFLGGRGFFLADVTRLSFTCVLAGCCSHFPLSGSAGRPGGWLILRFSQAEPNREAQGALPDPPAEALVCSSSPQPGTAGWTLSTGLARFLKTTELPLNPPKTPGPHCRALRTFRCVFEGATLAQQCGTSVPPWSSG